MLTLIQMQKILAEKDDDKRKAMIDALPEDDKKALLKEAKKLRQEGQKLISR